MEVCAGGFQSLCPNHVVAVAMVLLLSKALYCPALLQELYVATHNCPAAFIYRLCRLYAM